LAAWWIDGKKFNLCLARNRRRNSKRAEAGESADLLLASMMLNFVDPALHHDSEHLMQDMHDDHPDQLWCRLTARKADWGIS
jgi:hypothetical protein